MSIMERGPFNTTLVEKIADLWIYEPINVSEFERNRASMLW